MIYVVVLVMVVLLALLPQWWAQSVFRRHAADLPNIPGDGAALARHLISRFGLEGVRVERTDKGDHYDPMDRCVRLSAANFDGRSLTAVAVAAHEVGHALQHHRGEPLLALRTRLAHFALNAERIGALAMMALPVVGILTRSPMGGGLFLLIAVVSVLSATLVHLVTLPVELDASFNKALPVLAEGEYLPENDLGTVKRILWAAALTYVAASLASLLNVARWAALLRR